MASRLMISPVVEIAPDHLAAKAEQYCDLGFVNFFPSLENGMNASTWVLTIGRAQDWAAANADPQIEFVFPIPANINTTAELRAFLRANTLGDLTAGQRTTLQNTLDAHGVDRSDMTLATTGAQVLKRIVSRLFEKDHNFGMGFEF